MSDNYQNAIAEACDLVDEGRSDAEALDLAAIHYSLTDPERAQLAREFALLARHANAGGRRAEYEDVQAGTRWWNSLNELERARWLDRVPSATVADAWRAAKAGMSVSERAQFNAGVPMVRGVRGG